MINLEGGAAEINKWTYLVMSYNSDTRKMKLAVDKTGLNVLYRDAWESRMELTTVPSGTVYLSLEVLLRNVTEESMAWVT